MDDTTFDQIAEFDQLAECLLYIGWKRSEIEQLIHFLNNYEQTPMDQADFNIRHLEFIRWLVQKMN